jgi:outer membrane protein assembly factor BamD (BamD/ComL family)
MAGVSGKEQKRLDHLYKQGLSKEVGKDVERAVSDYEKFKKKYPKG